MSVTQESLHKKVARAVAACSEVARMQMRYGTPVSSGAEVSRAMRLARRPTSALHSPARYPGRRKR